MSMNCAGLYGYLRRGWRTAAVALCIGTAPPVMGAGEGDWPLHGLDYANTRYSTLTQMNNTNVAQLTLAWGLRTGKVGTFQATPIVIDGVMYLTTPYNDVLALDAASGKQIWRYT